MSFKSGTFSCPCPACQGKLVSSYVRHQHMKVFVRGIDRQVDTSDDLRRGSSSDRINRDTEASEPQNEHPKVSL